MGEEVRKASQLAKTYVYLAVYITLSSGQIFFNKWILSSAYYNFPYPVALTMIHMIFSSVLCFFVFRVFKILKLQGEMTFDMYMTTVVPIGAMFAMTLWLGNTAYLYISVSFAQMLKAALSWRMLGIMCLISGGVVVASYGEINFDWVGVVYQLGGVVGEATRLILIEVLLKRKGFKFDPLTMMYHISPCSAVFLFVPWLLLERPHMLSAAPGGLHFEPVVMTLNALCTFALNVSVFLVIAHTSALTARVAGVVKDWIVVLVSAALFADAKLTPINVAGYAVAIAGVVLYNRHKLQPPPGPGGLLSSGAADSSETHPLLLDMEAAAAPPHSKDLHRGASSQIGEAEAEKRTSSCLPFSPTKSLSARD
eukprot:jgi/Mesen1/5389/ME000268S04586